MTGEKRKGRREQPRFYASDTGKVVDEDYLDYVRAKPCVGCGKRPVDPDHLIARGHEEGKRVDYYTIPMCRRCHSEREQVGSEKFEVRHAVDLWRECARMEMAYLTELKKKGERT